MTGITDVITDTAPIDKEDTDTNQWDSYFEDPIFAQALRNSIEKDLEVTLEAYGVDNLFDVSRGGYRANLILLKENLITGEMLDDDFRSKILLLKECKNFHM